MSSIERAMERMNAEGGLQIEPREVRDSNTATSVSSLDAADSIENRCVDGSIEDPVAQCESPEASSSLVTTGRPREEAALSNIPYIKIEVERFAAAGLLTPNHPVTKESEEYQFIKRRLLGLMTQAPSDGDRPSNLILITSSVPGEGKTFTSVNLAISISMEVDHTVLAIDADIVRQGLSRIFGVENQMGLFDILADPNIKLESVLVKTSVPNLVILPAGTRHDGSTELLASLRMKELAKEISHRYPDRVVLFDSPPVLATTTATALAPLVGQLILIAEAGKTKHETIREALGRLDRFRITGVILNKSRQQSSGGYDYYGYHSSP